jgi:hypothetical protein
MYKIQKLQEIYLSNFYIFPNKDKNKKFMFIVKILDKRFSNICCNFIKSKYSEEPKRTKNIFNFFKWVLVPILVLQNKEYRFQKRFQFLSFFQEPVLEPVLLVPVAVPDTRSKIIINIIK